jgi:hypothetical protein
LPARSGRALPKHSVGQSADPIDAQLDGVAAFEKAADLHSAAIADGPRAEELARMDRLVHEILAEATIARSRGRAEALLEAHIASTLALVYPDGAERAS